MDVVTAFINGKLKEEIYMGAIEGIPLAPGMAYILHGALYGLKQAAREWYLTISKALSNFGFQSLPADECSFAKTSGLNPSNEVSTSMI
jgi:hypothetical protein